MIASLLSLFLVTPLPQTPPPATAPSTTELISLEHLLTRAGPRRPPPWGSLLKRADGDAHDPDLIGVGDGNGTFGIEQVVDQLRALHSGAIEQGHLQLEAFGSTLLAVGDAAEVGKLRDRIQQAAPLLARNLQIEVALWDAADRETPPAVMSAAEFTRWSLNLAPLAHGIATTSSGVATVVERMRWTTYVRDYDTEVAQKQSQPRPVTAHFGDGVMAAVRACALCGNDEYAVYVQFAAGQRRGATRSLQTGTPGAPEIEVPALETAYGACSARLANGGALAVTLRGHATGGGQHIVTVRVLSRTPPTNAIQSGFALLPTAALTSFALTRTLPDPDEMVAGDGAGEPEPTFGHLDAAQLVDLVRAHVASDELVIDGGSNFLLAKGPPAVLAKAEAFVRSLQDRLVRNGVVRSTTTLEPADAAAGGSVPLLHEITAPTLLGRQLTLARCFETNLIRDLWCVIAQEAAILDPSVAELQSGCWLSARLAPVDDSMLLRLRSHQQHALTPPARSVMSGGLLMTPEITRTIANHDGIVANGQPADHGRGPTIALEGRSYRSRVATSVRW